LSPQDQTSVGQRLSPQDQTSVGQPLSPQDQTAVGQGFSPPGQGAECAWRDYSLGGLAGYLTGFCDALGLTDIDLVANDTGGAIAQIFASRQPDRLRSLTLTNCETHNNVPPRLLLPSVWLARAGLFAPFAPRLLRNLPRARKSFYGPGYQNVEVLPLELVRRWQQPLVGDRRRAAELQRWLAALRPADLLAAEPALRKLRVPTLLVWGTDDRFFSVRWAYRLRETMPSVRRVVEVPGARLFFPDERPDDLTAPLLEHWHSAAASTA
jgi:pimeloyl-ACP methyl ester carboxylesterase